MLKKILATALAAAMILGLASVAFAASFSDTAGHARESSIKRLTGLGLLKGYTDGTFRPEGAITRAEFATIMVRALGLEAAADMLAGVPTGFPDVAENHWATGYIGVASSQGIIKGYPDGTFKPEANVSYAEAIAMIVRALGYEHEPSVKNGVWPTAYLTKAAVLGVSKGIAFNAAAFATRANVAALIANSLTIDRMVEAGFDEEGNVVYRKEVGNCFLSLMGASKVEGWLIESPERFDTADDKIVLADLKDPDDPSKDVELDVAEEDIADGLLGHKVRAWFTGELDEDTEEVFYVEDLTPADSVKTGTVDATNDVIKVSGKVAIDASDGDVIFRNFEGMFDTTDLVAGDKAVVIYEGSSPMWAVVTQYEWGIVKDVNLKYNRVNFADSSTDSYIKVDEDEMDVAWSGAALSLEDLEGDDVIDYIVSSDEESIVLVVTRNVVEGEFESLDLAEEVLEIDGEEFSWLCDDPSEDDLGTQVVALLNKDGKIVSLEPVDPAEVPTTVAAVISKSTGSDDFGVPVKKIKVRLSDGTLATLEVDESDDVDEDGNPVSDTWAELEEGDVISYTVDEDGIVDTFKVKFDKDGEEFDTATGEIVIDDDHSRVKWGSEYLKVTSGTVAFDLSGFVADTSSSVKAVTPETLLTFVADTTEAATVEGYVVESSTTGKASIVVITAGKADETGETMYGMVVRKYKISVDDEPTWVLRVLANGVTNDYQVSDTDAGAVSVEDVVAFDEISATKAENFVALRDDDVNYTVIESVYNDLRVKSVDIDNELITVQEYDADGDAISGTASAYVVTEDTVYFDLTGDDPESITLDDVAKMSKVTLYVDDEGVVVALVIEPEE